jgi:hypothetical protein
MKRFGILVVSLIVGVGFGSMAAYGATSPPTDLKLVGDHWTAWDPPEAGPDAYIIQKGDNLWDLAGKWFGNSYLWPQIYEENQYILDTHWIYPGDPLVVPGQPTVVPDEGPPPVADLPPAVDVRPDTEPVAEAVTTLPESMPLQPVATLSELHCSRYISAESQVPGLMIAGQELERKALGQGDVVFLNQGRNHGLHAGDTLRIRRWTKDVRHPSTNEVLGTVVRRMGKARILLAHDNTSTAVIEMSCEDIGVGDELVPWSEIAAPMMSALPPFDRLDPTSTGGATGQIVSARDNLWALGEGHVIYTDLGQHTGVSPGDVLLMYREREHGLPRMMLGQAVILTVETGTSTAKVMNSTRESEIGDWVEVWR